MNKLTKERLLYNLVDSFNDIIDEVSVSVKNVSIFGRATTNFTLTCFNSSGRDQDYLWYACGY